jgi:hypothetical protein
VLERSFIGFLAAMALAVFMFFVANPAVQRFYPTRQNDPIGRRLVYRVLVMAVSVLPIVFVMLLLDGHL